MQEMIFDALLIMLAMLGIVSVFSCIVMLDDLYKETKNNKCIELTLCTMLIAVLTLTFLCIPWYMCIRIYYHRELKKLERKRKRREVDTKGRFYD